MKKKKSKSKSKKKSAMVLIPDLPDKRYLIFKLPTRKFVRFPPSVDLREYCSPVEDQGELGSCTAQALVGALEYLENKTQGQGQYTDYSRLFLYYNERVYINTELEDSGAIIRDGIKSLNRKGICEETLWPHDISKFAEKPPKACYTDARAHKTVSYQRLNTFDQMKACLASGYPFIFGFTVYESFMWSENMGTIPMPDIVSESVIGGHAVLAVGYNEQDKRFLCRNSWGTKWGERGDFTMPYAYVKDRDLSDDFWTIRW
jgi:C1A family cysteine protease